MFKWIGAVIDRLFAVIGALIFLQAPQFIQQYQLQLKGHVDELHWQISIIRKAANLTGKNLNQYINKFLESRDADFYHQGQILNNIVERWTNLNKSLLALQEASIIKKPFVFLTNFNYDIAKTSFETFQLGISINFENAVYGIIGAIFGFFLYKILSRIIGLFLPKKLPNQI